MYFDDEMICFIKPITALAFFTVNTESVSDIAIFVIVLAGINSQIVFDKFIITHCTFSYLI